jgi:hypothetical protein
VRFAAGSDAYEVALGKFAALRLEAESLEALSKSTDGEGKVEVLASLKARIWTPLDAQPRVALSHAACRSRGDFASHEELAGVRFRSKDGRALHRAGHSHQQREPVLRNHLRVIRALHQSPLILTFVDDDFVEFFALRLVHRHDVNAPRLALGSREVLLQQGVPYRLLRSAVVPSAPQRLPKLVRRAEPRCSSRRNRASSATLTKASAADSLNLCRTDRGQPGGLHRGVEEVRADKLIDAHVLSAGFASLLPPVIPDVSPHVNDHASFAAR